MKSKIVLLLFIVPTLTFNLGAQQKTNLHIIDTFHIASSGGWDYIEVGPVNDWLYVSHGTQVNILNKKTGDSVGIIANTTGVHGIAFDAANSKGFTSNGRLNSVTVFDMNTNKVLAQIPVGANPDAIFYEPFSKKIITCNGRGQNLSIIDPVSNKLIDSIAVGGKPETAVSNDAGKIYVNIEDKNEIVVIDTKTFKVAHHWSIAPGDGPSGLAIDKINNRLFSGCDKLLMVVNAINGKIIDKLTIGDGCDGVAFDPSTKNIFSSNGDGTLTVIREISPEKFVVLENIITKKSARTLTLDKKTHLIYLPAADFESQAPGEKGWPIMKPGSFQVLVVGQ
ncbi:MAG: YncE family protein [Ferruginibacter sp.]